MTIMNRRSVLASAISTGAAVVSSPVPNENDELTPDQELVIAAGMNPEEADCWKKTAEAAAAFFKLPELHATDRQEVATAIHVIQNKLLGRPTYRKYIALAKKARGE